jgi:hypothetical protein
MLSALILLMCECVTKCLAGTEFAALWMYRSHTAAVLCEGLL